MNRKINSIIALVMTALLLATDIGSLPVVWAAEPDDGSIIETPEEEETIESSNEDAASDNYLDKEISDDTITEEAKANGEGEGDVSRLEWWQMLISAFHLTVDEDNYPDNYYYDINSSTSYYRDIMVATEFGIVDVDAGESIKADDAATREFAAHSLNTCIQYVSDNTEYTFTDVELVTYKDDVQVAIDHEWFSLVDGKFVPDAYVSSAEFNNIQEVAETAYAQLQIDADHNNSFKLKEGVKNLGELNAELSDEENWIIVHEKHINDLVGGDKFVILNDGIPYPYKAVSIEIQGNDTHIKYEGVGLDDVFSDIDIESCREVDLSEVEIGDVSDDIEISYIVGGTSENDYEDGVEYSSVEELYGREPSALKAKISKPVTGKYSKETDNATFVASITISNLEIESSYSLLPAKARYDLKGEASVQVGLQVKDGVEDDGIGIDFKEVAESLRLPIKIGMAGFFEIKPDLNISGTLSYNSKWDFSVGVECRIGSVRLIPQFHKKSFTFNCKVEVTVGIKASLGIHLSDIISGDVFIGVGAKGSAEWISHPEANNEKCIDISAYLYCNVGAELKIKLLTYKKNYSVSWPIWDKTNSPVKLLFHIEDGKVVNECTRGANGNIGEDPEVESINPNVRRKKYYTPVDSRYGWVGLNTGTNSAGEEFTIFETTKNDDKKEATITKYNGNVSALSIPADIDGYKVVEIATGAFKARNELVYVGIPNTVVTIQAGAFAKCLNLQSVVLSNTLESMGAHAFFGCVKLSDICIPKSLKQTTKAYINEYEYGYTFGPFGKCESLKTVSFEEGTTIVANGLFRNCTGLEEITIPDTVTNIGSIAFQGCSNLRSIKLGSALTEIGSQAFANCVALTSVSIPDTVTSIAPGAFAKCDKLSDVTLSKGLTSMGAHAFFMCNSLESIEIPKSLQSTTKEYINEYEYDYQYGPFGKCANLKNVTFEEGTTRVANGLFRNCTGLEEITIPNTVTVINSIAFRDCVNLKKVTLSNSLTSIGQQAFSNCTALVSISIPDSVTSMGAGAFAKCNDLSEVTLSKGLKTIGAHAFFACNSLTSIEIPKSLESTYKEYLNEYEYDYKFGPFGKCAGLKNVTFEVGTTRVANALFRNCTGLEEITIPDTVISINEDAFQGCTSLKKVTIGKSVTTIGNYAFNNCSSLKDIVVPNNVTGMGNYVFCGCSSLESAVLPNVRKNLSEGMFSGCKALTTITLPDSLTAIRSHAFEGCSSLPAINIPSGVTVIEDVAFKDCKALEKVEFSPNSSLTIGKNAFRYCDALEKVTMSSGVTSMGEYCFESCPALKDVILGNGLTAIPQYCFANNESLESIVLPYYVKSIGAYAFNNDTKLASITIPRSTTTIATTAFSYKDKLTIYGVAGTYAETFANTNGFKFVNQEINATNVSFSQETYTIYTNATFCLPFTVTPDNFTDEMTWAISKGSDRISLTDGIVKGLKVTVANDPAVVKLMVGDKLASCKIVVLQSVTSLNLNKTSLTLDAEDSFQLTCSVYPDSASDKTVSWSSSDSNIASVDENGKVTAIAQGSCTITVTANDGGGASKSCTVTVKGSAHHPKNEEEMQSEHPYAKNCSDIWIYRYEGAENICMTFSAETKLEEDTEGDYILIKDKDSKQIGKYYGTDLAGQTVMVPGDTFWLQLVSDSIDSKDYGFSVTKIETNEDVVEVTEISISPKAISLKEGNEGTLTATITPENATNKSVTWTSSNPEVATVNASGETVTIKALKAGKTTITAKAGIVSATAEITVTGDEPAVEAITLSKKKLSMKVNDEKELSATISPSEAADEALTWECSNEGVITINGSGSKIKVKAVGEGSAKVTVSAANGVKATCDITVSAEGSITDDSPMNPVEPIDDNTTDLHLVKGQKFTLSESGWVSSDKKTLAISKTNVMIAKKVTTAPIKLTNSGRSINVYVTQPKMVAKSIMLQVGNTQTIGFTYDSDNLGVQWYCNTPDIATVNDDGEVTAVGKGTATITAYVNGSAYTCKVKVKEDIPAVDRTIHMTIHAKKTISIKGVKKVTWVSDDEGTVSVKKKNKITANAIGETVVRTEYEGKEYRIRVFVEDPTIISKSIQSSGKNKYKLTLSPGVTTDIEFASVVQPVIFKSNKGETAYADADGTIHTYRPGKAKLTAKINGKTITITVYVK